MSIVKTGAMYGQVGKMGRQVYYSAMGETRGRELAANVTNPRTEAQMSQRVRWSNLVNLYRANQTWMKYAFESKKRNQSDYNKFMSVNVATSPIFLTKSIAAGGGCVVAPYIITQGSLPSIEFRKIDGEWLTNLYVPADFDIVSATTVGQVTQALLAENPALREGDQLSFIRMTQQVNSMTGVPYVIVRKYEVLLNSNDPTPFGTFMPLDYIGIDSEGQTNQIVVIDSGLAGGFVMCISRTNGGRTSVSTQSIIVANNSVLINAYSDSAALAAAIASYGETTEPFLTTATANVASTAPVGNSILAMTVEGRVYIPGRAYYPHNIMAADTGSIQLSGVVEGSVVGATITVFKGTTSHDIELTDVAGSGDQVTFEVPNAISTYENWALAAVKIQVGGQEISTTFAIPNAATIGGLE